MSWKQQKNHSEDEYGLAGKNLQRNKNCIVVHVLVAVVKSKLPIISYLTVMEATYFNENSSTDSGVLHLYRHSSRKRDQ